jgi:hypothetical protein
MKMSNVERVYEIMKGGTNYTPHAMRQAVGFKFGVWMSAEATTARIRDLRKTKYGGHDVKKVPVAGTNHFQYYIKTQMTLLEAFRSAHLEVLISDRDLEVLR